jgi:hypothetical protein
MAHIPIPALHLAGIAIRVGVIDLIAAGVREAYSRWHRRSPSSLVAGGHRIQPAPCGDPVTQPLRDQDAAAHIVGHTRHVWRMR